MSMKLTDAEVRTLRALASDGVPVRELGERFGISRRHAARLATANHAR
jgi:hypothetical protein